MSPPIFLYLPLFLPALLLGSLVTVKRAKERTERKRGKGTMKGDKETT